MNDVEPSENSKEIIMNYHVKIVGAEGFEPPTLPA